MTRRFRPAGFDPTAGFSYHDPMASEKRQSGMSSSPEEDGTREKLKSSAIRLFSLYGIDGVSVRAVLGEAGVRNSAGIHYYFRTKDELIRELVVDATARSSRARTAMLDALEESGRPISVRDIVRLIVQVETTGTGDPEQHTDLPIGFGHMRFVSAMQLNHREKFMAAVGERGDRSFERCMQHIRDALPEVPRTVLNQRLIFFYQFINASLSAREAAYVENATGGSLWGHPEALDNLIDTLAAGLIGCAVAPQPDG